MKTTSKNVRIITHGEMFSELKTTDLRRAVSRSRDWSSFKGRGGATGEYLLVSSNELDDAFVEAFRKYATQATRLLVFQNEEVSTDRLLSRIVDMQIRKPQRFYVMEVSSGYGKTHRMDLLHSLLRRLTSALQAADKRECILDAKVEDEVLHVISPDLNRIDVLIADIPEFQNIDASKIQNFKIDKDGSFIYWPDLDLHLGWEQLKQIVDPEAARKALQKTREFNIRYGKAVRTVREEAGLKSNDIPGLSVKQLRRIESGVCRLTSNAIQTLSTAHQVKPNEYLNRLAAALD